MFDTNIFNHILDGSIPLEKMFGKAQFIVTHIQVDELTKTKDPSRKLALMNLLSELINEQTPTESFILDTSRLGEAKLSGDNIIPTESSRFDLSRFDHCKWSENDNLYDPIKNQLDEQNNSKNNNIQDALIAETAIKNNIPLITDDKDLNKIMAAYSCSCLSLNQFLKEIEK